MIEDPYDGMENTLGFIKTQGCVSSVYWIDLQVHIFGGLCVWITV